MNKKYRIFGKIPVVDILILLILAVVVAACAFFLTRGEVKEQTGADAQAKTYPFEAVLCMSSLSRDDALLAEVGDKLYLEDGTFVATVTAKESKPHYRYGFDGETGACVQNELEGKVDLYLTVKGEATARSEKGIMIGKKRLAFNSFLTLGNEKFLWKMVTVDITREEA